MTDLFTLLEHCASAHPIETYIAAVMLIIAAAAGRAS